MPQQLIYTSAPRGIVPGRSGYCTVARSASMREALMLQIEKLSYYQHLSLAGGKDRPIFAVRSIDLRGARYHVLTRIQDAGLDFTGRTNFIAHHLVFTPEEIRQAASAPVIFLKWPGWRTGWSAEPQLLEKEDWLDLHALAAVSLNPAKTWGRVTEDAVNGYGLLEARAGSSFRVDSVSDEVLLELIGESLALLEVREPRKDPKVAAWQCTFTTSMQEQDNPADFRWRFLHSDNPGANRFATPDCRPIAEVKTAKASREEAEFARAGARQPQILEQPMDARCMEGDAVRLAIRADGIPTPTYQWYSIDRANNGVALEGETKPELLIPSASLGVTRYMVAVQNRAGSLQSKMAAVACERKPTPVQFSASASRRPSYVRSAEDIEDGRRRFAEKAAREDAEKRKRKKSVIVAGVVASVFVSAAILLWAEREPKARVRPNQSNAATNNTNTTLPVVATNQALAVAQPATSSPSIPPEWKITEIGLGKKQHAILNPDGFFDILGSGTGFGMESDSVFFLSRTNLGKVIEASINNVGDVKAGFAGVMMRQSAEPHSAFIFIGVGDGRAVSVWRPDKKPIGTNGFSVSFADLKIDVTSAPVKFALRLEKGGLVTLCVGDKELPKKQMVFPEADNVLVGFVSAFAKQEDEKLTTFHLIQ